MDIAAWLRELGLEQYEQAFIDNAVDREVLPSVTAEDLKEIGVAAVGHRRKLLQAIAELNRASGFVVADVTSAVAAVPLAEIAGERRQVTVLFADLAGYTSLSSQLDAEEIHRLLDHFFGRVDGIVGEHGGHIDKHIGDCVMAVFGAPIAHGNDAERAIRAALAIRDAMPELSRELGRQIAVHIGVAGGQVVASSTGSASHREYTVTGDTVNLASRLTDAAAHGEILVSEEVRRALPDRLDCIGADPLAMKGFPHPVKPWRLRGFRRTQVGERPPFIGRDSELRQFKSALVTCRDTGRGQTIYVRAEAGIGKTGLIHEFQRAAREAGFSCHTGLVLDFGAGTGRDAIRALMRSLLGVAEASHHDDLRGAAERALAAGLVAPPEAVFLNDLLDLPQPADFRSQYDAMDNAARNTGKRRTVARVVERASGLAPLLLTVEDVHWADRLTLDHLAKLASTAADHPVLLVLTSRVEGDPLGHEWRSRVSGAPLMTIDLGPLRREEALALASAFHDEMDRFAEQCVDRAAGNPLFLEQLLRHAQESTNTAVPGSVQSLVQARVDRLKPDDKAALQAASVLGQRFGRDALRHLLDWPGYEPDRLVTNHLLRPLEDGFLFAHALIRDAVYDALLKSRRQQLHRRAADWFGSRDAALRAEHLDRAQDPEAPRAYLAAALSQAREYRFESARRLVERGVVLATEATDRFELASMLGDVLHDLGDMGAALKAFEAALTSANTGSERCRALIGLASVKRVTDDLDGAFADLDQAEAEAASQDLSVERARIHGLRGNLFFPKGNIEGCLREHAKSLEIARAAGSAELEVAALGGLGDAEYVRGRMITSHDRLRECVELSRKHGFSRIEVSNFAQLAHTRLYFQPQQDALEHAVLARIAAEKVGHSRAELNARAAAVFAYFSLAELKACRETSAEALELAQRLGSRRFESQCHLTTSRADLADGRRAAAIVGLEHALEISRTSGMTFNGPQIYAVLARALERPEEKRRSCTRARRSFAPARSVTTHLGFTQMPWTSRSIWPTMMTWTATEPH